jgi:cell division protein FtsL
MEIILSILIIAIFCLAWALYFVLRSMWSMQADIEKLNHHVAILHGMIFPLDNRGHYENN